MTNHQFTVNSAEFVHNLQFYAGTGDPIVTFKPDGVIEFGERYRDNPDAAARAFIECALKHWPELRVNVMAPAVHDLEPAGYLVHLPDDRFQGHDFIREPLSEELRAVGYISTPVYEIPPGYRVLPAGWAPVPTSIDEARAMALLGLNYLEMNSPDTIRASGPTGSFASVLHALLHEGATIYRESLPHVTYELEGAPSVGVRFWVHDAEQDRSLLKAFTAEEVTAMDWRVKP